MVNQATARPAEADGQCGVTITNHLTDVHALRAEVERLTAALNAIEALYATQWSWDPPPSGILVVGTYSGGHQDLPETEHVYSRADSDETKDERGDWYEVGGPTGEHLHPRSWGEVMWQDDPECDRGSVSTETFVPVDAIAAIIDGTRGGA